MMIARGLVLSMHDDVRKWEKNVHHGFCFVVFLTLMMKGGLTGFTGMHDVQKCKQMFLDLAIALLCLWLFR